jgi:hypothetical protein
VGYHLIVAVIMGGLVASYILPTPFPALAAAMVCIGAVLLMQWARSHLGFFVNGWRRGKTRGVTFALLACVLTALAIGMYFKMDRGVWWAPLPCGLAAFVATFFWGRAWERLYRAELAEGL